MRKIITALVIGAALAGTAMAEDGAALYKSKMCGACHGAGKKGGELKSSTMDKATMVKFMKDPKSVNPKATMPAVKGSDTELNALADYAKTLK
jgi:mono/diheme cytochrome c family protein